MSQSWPEKNSLVIAAAIEGTPGDDKLEGTSGDDVINGLEGNDSLLGKTGNDSLDGGAGNDILNGAAGIDSLDGGAGNDTLYGGASYDGIFGGEGDDTLDGGAGNDTLYGGANDDWISGGEGDDILDGGSGNDITGGSYGDDSYLFGVGSGQDTMSDSEGTNRVVLAAGIETNDVTLKRLGDSVVLKIKGTDDQLTMESYFSSDDYAVDRIEFAGGTVWDPVYVRNRFLQPTEGDDILRGFGSDDMIDGLGGNDAIYGEDGDDTLEGGAGDDRLYGNYANDTLRGGAGNDYLEGDSGNFSGGDDILDGGAGDDDLRGGRGNDTYLFGTGSGDDFINNYDDGFAATDRILVGAGITTDDVTVKADANQNLILSIKGTYDRIVIFDHFVSSNAIDSIEFADGTVWGKDDIPTNIHATRGGDVLYGTSGDDAIIALAGGDIVHGGQGNDVLEGYGGNDWLNGDGGNDVLQGGGGADRLLGKGGDDILHGSAGDDFLHGGPGDDIYRFGLGGGHDTIDNHIFFISDRVGSEAITSGGTGRIELGAGITADNVTLSADVKDLVLTFSSGDTLTVDSHFGRGVIDYIKFADGTVWDWDDIIARLPGPTEGNDSLYGTAGDDSFDGLGGNDRLFGYSGNDTLAGGAGNDRLEGDSGNDTYLFGLGSGRDNISDHGGETDRVVMGAGIGPEDVTVSDTGYDLLLKINGTSDALTLFGAGYGTSYRIETVEFADGTLWDMTTMSFSAIGVKHSASAAEDLFA